MTRNVLLSEDREIPLLMFLWKWKVSTTAALIRKFFPNCSGKTAYNRILSLRQAGLIRVRADGQGQKFLCTLDEKGFEAIREHLPYLKEAGYKSEHIGHDLLVSAFHLGDWLKEKPSSAALFSEQELRRFDPEFYPKWLPKSDIHRPDGYTLVSKGDSLATFAIEVELHYKRDSDYLRIAEFYRHFRGIERVLWLVPRESMMTVLNKKMVDPYGKIPSPHNFILLDEFKALGWDSRISLGPELNQPLSKLLPKTVPDLGENRTDSSLVRDLLDTRKSPHISTIYRGYHFGDFSD